MGKQDNTIIDGVNVAGVEPYYKKRIECKDGYEIGYPCDKPPCISCDKAVFEDVYPQFTAARQLEVIKLIGDIHIQHHCIKYGIYAESDGHYDTDYQEYDADLVCEKRIYFNDKNPFEQALAQLTTELMNAGELDKSKVKEILEQ